MLGTSLTSATDRRPFIAIVPWDSGFRAWDPLESPSGETWNPRGARAVTLPASAPDQQAQVIVQKLVNQDLSAVLLIGRSNDSGTIHIQTRAENRLPGTHDRDDPLAAGVVRATMATAEVLRELSKADFKARTESEAENDEGSHLLFRILSRLPDTITTPPIGLMRLPRDMSPIEVNQAVRIVASTISQHLPSLSPAS